MTKTQFEQLVDRCREIAQRNNAETSLDHFLVMMNNLQVDEDYLEKHKLYECYLADVLSQFMSSLCNNEDIENVYPCFTHPMFEEKRQQMEEYDAFIEMPPQIEEGVVTCPKCHNNRVYSYSMQIRRSDEGMTVISNCGNCRHRWASNS